MTQTMCIVSLLLNADPFEELCPSLLAQWSIPCDAVGNTKGFWEGWATPGSTIPCPPCLFGISALELFSAPLQFYPSTGSFVFLKWDCFVPPSVTPLPTIFIIQKFSYGFYFACACLLLWPNAKGSYKQNVCVFSCWFKYPELWGHGHWYPSVTAGFVPRDCHCSTL